MPRSELASLAAGLRRIREDSLGRFAPVLVISQPFPVVALCGPRTEAETRNCARAGDLTLTGAERDWLDLRSDTRPF